MNMIYKGDMNMNMNNNVIPVAYTHYLGEMTREEQHETYNNLPEEYTMYQIYLDDDTEPYFHVMVGSTDTKFSEYPCTLFESIKACQQLSSAIDCDTDAVRELEGSELQSVISEYLNPVIQDWATNLTYIKVYCEPISDDVLITVFHTIVEFRISQYPDLTFKIVYI